METKEHEGAPRLTLYRERLFILADDWPGRGPRTRELALHQIVNRVAASMENALGRGPTFFEDFDGGGGGSRLPLTPGGLRLWLSLVSGEGCILLPKLLCIGDAAGKRPAMYSARMHLEWTGRRHWRLVPTVALFERTRWSVAQKERTLLAPAQQEGGEHGYSGPEEEDSDNPMVHLFLSNWVRVRALTPEEASGVSRPVVADVAVPEPAPVQREGFLSALAGGPVRLAVYLSWRVPKAIEDLTEALDDAEAASDGRREPPRPCHNSPISSSLLDLHPFF